MESKFQYIKYHVTSCFFSFWFWFDIGPSLRFAKMHHFLSLISVSYALKIDSPSLLSRAVPSPIAFRLVGNQDPGFSVTGLATAIDIHACGTFGFDKNQLKGKVVFLTSQPVALRMSHEEASVECLETFGAIAVVRVTKHILQPG